MIGPVLIELVQATGGCGIGVEDRLLLDQRTNVALPGKVVVVSILLRDVWHEIATPLDQKDHERSVASCLSSALEIAKMHEREDRGGCKCEEPGEQPLPPRQTFQA